MNTCKTNNPNYLLIDSSLDRSSVESFYWDCTMNGFSDYVTYDCDDSDCDHEYCMTIDVFNVDRVDRLLFPELENVSKVYIWNSEYTGIGYELIELDQPIITYALGL